MLAALLNGPETLSVEEIETPKCPTGGLLLRVEACSLCSTDVKMIRSGQKDLRYPRILGHEIAGVVEECRDESGFEEGDRVQLYPGIPCGSCSSCMKGAENQCSSVQIYGFNRDGGLAEFVAVSERSVQVGINQIPEMVGFEEAALSEPLACCINAQERSYVGENDSVLIFGSGPTGCLHALLARDKGASQIIMAEPLKMRLRQAKRAKPDLVINSSEEDVRRSVLDFTHGKGVDVIILASRDVSVNDDLLSLLAPRGRLCLFSGLPETRAHSRINLNRVHYREVLMTGAYGCTSAQNRKALDLISSGLDVSWLITEKISLKRIWEGIDHAERRKGMRAMVTEFR